MASASSRILPRSTSMPNGGKLRPMILLSNILAPYCVNWLSCCVYLVSCLEDRVVKSTRHITLLTRYIIVSDLFPKTAGTGKTGKEDSVGRSPFLRHGS